MEWLNEPPHWRSEDDALVVTTGDKTDFWRETHYGFIRDDGHLRYTKQPGDFTAEVTVSGQYREIYDQAGLMIRLDPNNWIKAGVEFVHGKRLLSCVVTRDVSDWSIVPMFDAPDPFRLKLTRQGTAVRVEWAPTVSEAFETLRLAYFPSTDMSLIGPMCCSPQRAGFEARFTEFRIGSPTARGLHD